MRDDHAGRVCPNGTAVLPAAAIGAGAESAITGTVAPAGVALPQMLAIANPRTAVDVGLVVKSVRVSAADTVEVTVRNDTAAPIAPAAAITFDLMVLPKD